MRTDRLLLVLASLLLPLSAYAAPPSQAANAGAQGVPFERLQQQIDQLRERIRLLENASPAGQSCPPGQFVTGFSNAGAILCATTTGGTPTPPPPPGPIPLTILSALEQAILGLAGPNFPIPPAPTTVAAGGFTVTVRPQSYSLSVGAVDFSQPNAALLSILVTVPGFNITSVVSVSSPLGLVASGTVTVSASDSRVRANVGIVDAPAGQRRLGAVTSTEILLGTTGVTNTVGIPVDFLTPVFQVVEGQLAGLLQAAVANAVSGTLPNLPDF